MATAFGANPIYIGGRILSGAPRRNYRRLADPEAILRRFTRDNTHGIQPTRPYLSWVVPSRPFSCVIICPSSTTPLIYPHVTAYGTFHLDMSTGVPIQPQSMVLVV